MTSHWLGLADRVCVVTGAASGIGFVVRTVDARTAKALVEALTKQKNDSLLIKSPEFESDGRDSSNAKGEEEDFNSEGNRGGDGGKSRPDKDDPSRPGASERSNRDRQNARDRDTPRACASGIV